MSKGKQLYFEDVVVGSEVPPLYKLPTPRQLVIWAGASGDYNEIHYNSEAAIQQNLPGIIIHGRLKAAFLGQLITDWIGKEGTVKKLSSSFRKMDYPMDPLICKGKVIKKYTIGDEDYVECDTWIENSQGEKTTTGSAVFTIPSRNR